MTIYDILFTLFISLATIGCICILADYLPSTKKYKMKLNKEFLYYKKESLIKEDYNNFLKGNFIFCIDQIQISDLVNKYQNPITGFLFIDEEHKTIYRYIDAKQYHFDNKAYFLTKIEDPTIDNFYAILENHKYDIKEWE